MQSVADSTPKLKSDNSDSRANQSAGDALAAALFDDYCRKFMTAEQTNSLEDAEAAGHARTQFLSCFEKLPGVSAEVSL